MTSTIGRGLAAGAVGGVLLDAATWLDMAVTGRPASSAPQDTVLAALDAAGLDVPEDNRVAAYGALSGIGVGLGIGVVASVARRLGVRLPAPLGALAIGAGAMAAADCSMLALGVSDPSTWTAEDWARDAVPHLLYGAGVRWALDRMEPAPSAVLMPVAAPALKSQLPLDRAAPTRVTSGLLLRCAALGVASGGRSTLGLTMPALASGNPVAALAARSLVATELTVDKLPGTPSRLEPGPLLGRLGAGAVGGFTLARREGVSGRAAALAGVLGGYAGSVAGAAWREVAARRGYTWQGAVAEDVAALGLAAFALRRGR